MKIGNLLNLSCGYLQVTYDLSNFCQVTKGSAVVLSYMFLGGGSGPGPRSAPGHWAYYKNTTAGGWQVIVLGAHK